MAHLQPNYPNILKAICRKTSCSTKNGEIGLTELGISWRDHNLGVCEKRKTWEKERGFVGQCYSYFPSPYSSSTSSNEEVEKVGFGCLVREYGWRVRRLVEDQSEMRKVAQIQAQAFYVPVLLFNDLFFYFFQADVLAGLLYRLRNSPPDRYACLVAEPSIDATETGLLQEIVGVVDVTVLRNEAVLQHLPGAEEYLYVSGIAVLNNFRRKKVATALLKACEMLSILWCSEYLVLQAYEDDWGALKLYRNAGYRIVSRDPQWMTTWIGRKRRVLMIKRPN